MLLIMSYGRVFCGACEKPAAKSAHALRYSQCTCGCMFSVNGWKRKILYLWKTKQLSHHFIFFWDTNLISSYTSLLVVTEAISTTFSNKVGLFVKSHAFKMNAPNFCTTSGCGGTTVIILFLAWGKLDQVHEMKETIKQNSCFVPLRANLIPSKNLTCADDGLASVDSSQFSSLITFPSLTDL